MRTTEHTPKTPIARTGFFETLRGRLGATSLSLSLSLSLRRLTLAASALCLSLGLLLSWGAPARAAAGHTYLPGPSEAIDAGVPEGASAGEATFKGPLGDVLGLAAGPGRVWVADLLENEQQPSRIDAFGSSSGAFLPPQLIEEGGVRSPEHGLAAGSLGGEEVVYAGVNGAGQRVVAVYSAAGGKLLHVWTGENTARKSFDQLAGVAVDSSASLETAGDVYVASAGFESPANVVDVLVPQPNGEEPAKPAAEISGTCPSPGEVVGGAGCEAGVQEVPFTAPSSIAVSGANGDVLVTDNERVVDVFHPTVLGEYEFVRQITTTPTGEGGAQTPFGSVGAVAADASNGDIFVADEGTGAVDQFSQSGEYLGRMTRTPAGPFHRLKGLAVDASGHVYVGSYDEESKAGFVDVFAPTVVLPDVSTAEATGITVSAAGDIQATLNGSVNPRGAGSLTSCAFAWGFSEAFESPPAACEPQAIPDGTSPVAVTAPLSHLAPDSTYRFRLQAGNANGVNPGESFQTKSFVTPGPGLHGAFAAEVSSTSASLGGRIDPHGAPTSFYFQYGTSTSYGAQAPATPASIGEEDGKDVKLPAQHLQSLTPSTTYHYRLVALSELQAEGSLKTVAFPGPDQTFTTQAPAGGLTLPDARQWQLVSPPDKHGATISPLAFPSVLQASAAGDAFTYVTNLPTTGGASGNDETIQQLSTRNAGGWSNLDLATANPAPLTPVGYGGAYRAFSPDLSTAIIEPPGTYSSFAPEVFPPDSEHTPYLRHNTSCTSIPPTCYEPLLTTAPGYANVPEGTVLGTEGGGTGNEYFRGASPDQRHVVLSAKNVPLATNAPAGQLYEWSAGSPVGTQPTLVSVLPDGKPTALGAKLGDSNGFVVRGAISADGSRVVWTEERGHLYLRDVELGQTVQLDLVQPGASGANGAKPAFQLVSPDGSRLLFTDEQRLTKDSHALSHQRDLYACEIVVGEGRLGCRLSDLTAGAEASDVQGSVIGASADASTVYYTANAKLAAGAVHGDCERNTSAADAQCNMYVSVLSGGVWGAPRLVAVVSGDDFPDWVGDGGGNLTNLTARVSADGRRLVFMSDRSLTGYDNRDAVSEQLDEEVYVYQAGVGVRCVSCDPTGARPVGVEYGQINGQLVGGDRVWPNAQWIAANIPGWTPYSLQQAAYASRVLSDSGRVFFNAFGPLVPRDINRNQDVYEYEPTGVGNCSSAPPAGAVLVPGGEACAALISSGRASGESAFLDASESGGDVFFLTGERLTASDTDSSLDVYDAHVCTSASPCLSEASQPPPCATADACHGAPAPQPSIFGAPASSEFHGPGNLAPTPPASHGTPCSSSSGAPAKGCTRKQNLTKALASCRRRFAHSKKKRALCEHAAHKKYGTAHRAKRHR